MKRSCHNSEHAVASLYQLYDHNYVRLQHDLVEFHEKRKRRAKKGIQIQQVQQPMKKMTTEKNQVGTSSSSSSSSSLNAIHQSEEMKEDTAKHLKVKGIQWILEQIQKHKNEFQQKSNNK